MMQSDLSKVIAQRMAQIRKLRKLSQADVAKALGINQQNYSHYEQGLRVIPLKRVTQLADVLEVSAEELLGFTQKSKKRGPISSMENRLSKVEKLPKKKQKEILHVVDALIAQAS